MCPQISARYYEYGINPNGNQWTKVSIAKANSPRWEKTTRDLLGRVIAVEKPGFEGVESTTSHYNTIGQLVGISTPAQADTLYRYDSLGNQISSGLDVNNNGKLDPISQDRILNNQNRYIKLDNNWWLQSESSVLALDNSNHETGISTSLRRLTGWDGRIVAESRTKDIHGNETIVTELLDRHNRTRINSTTYPDSTVAAEQIIINNRLIRSRSKTGVEKSFGYDALGRRITSTDKRTGMTTTHYTPKGQIDSLEDPSGSTQRFIYDPETGHRVATINALNKSSYFAYNLREQRTRTWGDVPYPVEYIYNEYGETVGMHTFRGDEGWNQKEWPKHITKTDETIWKLQESTGLLLTKNDAKGNGVAYGYKTGGKLGKRTWARGITTTYNYSPNTGELQNIDYSDSTPDISFKYDRLGRKTQVNDAIGTHQFKYNDTLQLEEEGITGKVKSSLTRQYDNLGRSNGFSLGQDYSVGYSYDATGRFNSIDWQVAGKTGSADYGYLENSDLLSGLNFDKDISVTYEYESQRDLRTTITNKTKDKLISRYEYQYDRLGRRSNVKNSGSAFAKQDFKLYNYNDRNELQTSSTFTGNDLLDQTNPIVDEERFYQYDSIGNRTKAYEAEKQTDYVANELNQYSSIAGPQKTIPEYDIDGNLTQLKKDSTIARYIYNGENRLVVVEPYTPIVGNTKSEFVYDYQGRRRIKRMSTYKDGKWHQNVSTSFIYDGWNLIAVLDKSGVTEASYVWGLDLSHDLQGAGGIGGLITRIDVVQDKAHFYFYDGNGNVGQLVDSTDGILAASYNYDPYGNSLSSEGVFAEANPFKFSTKYWDGDTGLYYYGYRFYSPELGRWINRDPIAERGGLNLYGFVGNEPVGGVDMLGLWGKAVHYGLTSNWAISLAYDKDAGEAIAQANNDVDSGSTNPVTGDQSYHFDRPWGGEDSRLKHFENHNEKAKKCCSLNDGKDNPEEAAKELGTALHPLQDWWAHGDYGKYTNGRIMVVHNGYSLQYPFDPDSDDPFIDVSVFPDDPALDVDGSPDGRPVEGYMRTREIGRGTYLWATYVSDSKRISGTKRQTQDALRNFQTYLKGNNVGCECKKYFGVN